MAIPLRPDPTQEEIDAMAVRCGLLPHEKFLREARPTFGPHVPMYRCTGATTQSMLSALILAEHGEMVVVTGPLPQREHATRAIRQMAEAAGIPGEVLRRVKFSRWSDDPGLRGLPPHHYHSA